MITRSWYLLTQNRCYKRTDRGYSSSRITKTRERQRSCLSHKLEFGLTIDIFPEENGAATGSLVAAVVANIYMEEFEEQAIANATCKPKIWKGYVDDTFTVSDRDHVNGFLQHLNSQQPTIRFTMEIKKDNTNPLST